MATSVPSPVSQASAGDRAGGFFRALHPFPSFLVAGLSAALVPLADGGAPLSRYVQLALGMLCYQFAIGLTNDVVDAPDDAVTKPRKPIPSGLVGSRTAALAAIGFTIAGAAVTVTLPFAAWLIGLAALSCGLVYDLWLKRSAWSWLPLAVAFPLLPLWAWAAAGRWESRVAWVLPLGMLLGLSVHLANQAPDVAQDRMRGIEGAAQRIGAASGPLAVAIFVAVALAAAAVAVGRSAFAALGLVAVAAVAGALSPWSTRLFGRDGLFGLLAVASAGIAILFLWAIQARLS